MGNVHNLKKEQLENTELACNISKNVKSVIGLPSKTLSASDQWILYFKKPYILINGEEIDKAFAKVFITSKNTEELRYEMEVYYQKTKPLNDYLICPFFVPCYMRAKNCSIQNIYSILKNHVVDLNTNEILDTDTLIQNFKRNIVYMVFGHRNRPSINDNRILDEKYISDYLKIDPASLKFNFILTRVMDTKTTETLNEFFNMIERYMEQKEEESLSLEEKDDFDKRMYFLPMVLFQVMCGIYAMFLSGMTHNDLHFGNIFIIKLDSPVIIRHYIEKTVFQYKTPYRVQIFDFDRAFAESLGNNPFFHKSSYSNKVNPYTDIFKFFCLLKKINVYKDLEIKMLNWNHQLETCLIPDEPENPKDIENLFKIRVFLREKLNEENCRLFNTIFPQTLFDYLYLPYDVLLNFAKIAQIQSVPESEEKSLILNEEDFRLPLEVYIMNTLQFDVMGNISEQEGLKNLKEIEKIKHLLK